MIQAPIGIFVPVARPHDEQSDGRPVIDLIRHTLEMTVEPLEVKLRGKTWQGRRRSELDVPGIRAGVGTMRPRPHQQPLRRTLTK